MLRRRRAEARARQQAQREAQQRMNEFLSLASHDLKTPLTSVKGNIQLMVRRLKRLMGTNNQNIAHSSAEELVQTLVDARELLERTDQQLTRLTRLVNTLLESARSTTSTHTMLLEACELEALLQEVLREKQHIPETRTVLMTLADAKTTVVMADSYRIKQVIHHYLSNAHKFSALEVPIEVHLQEDGHVAYVSVRDKGPGIPKTEHTRIWEQFYRVPGIKVYNGTEVGLGLGLHICRTIIEQHRGKVGLYSTPGSGSTFWFSLPLLQKDVQGL